MLSESYQSALGIMKEASKSFYAAFNQLPQPLFYAVAAVYAFCRQADDSVDHTDSESVALEQLAQLENLIINQAPLEKLWVPAFQDARSRFQIPDQPFLNQIEGQKMDIQFTQPETMDDLVDYSRYVAGSVGEMLVPILVSDSVDADQSHILSAAIDLGIGMQLTNILRDVGEDLIELDRIYLPISLLKKYQLTKQDLHQMIDDRVILPGYQALLDEVMVLSDKYYQSIEKVVDRFHPRAQLAVLASARIYHAIEEKIKENGYNNLTKRNYTSPLDRVKIVRQLKKEGW